MDESLTCSVGFTGRDTNCYSSVNIGVCVFQLLGLAIPQFLCRKSVGDERVGHTLRIICLVNVDGSGVRPRRPFFPLLEIRARHQRRILRERLRFTKCAGKRLLKSGHRVSENSASSSSSKSIVANMPSEHHSEPPIGPVCSLVNSVKT